jgi:hypothetical protein
MFVQVIRGQLADREAMKRLGDRWEAELRPGAAGFLGATIGITDDGWMINVARFESEEAARRNSDRPEQGEWWAEASKCFDGEPSFLDSTDVETTLGGGRDDAGFVQAMIGEVRDRAAFTEVDRQFVERITELRPDVIGGVRVWDGDRRYVELVYFTSEDDARRGESQELPADVGDAYQRFQDLHDSIEFRDLRDVKML